LELQKQEMLLQPYNITLVPNNQDVLHKSDYQVFQQ
jgi:hypothetical protein